MRAILLLLTPAILAVLVTAQCNCGCSFPVRAPVYSQPPPMHFPLYPPPPPQQNMMPCYQQPQPPQIILPIPPPPKGCSSAKTTVQQHPMMPQFGNFPGFHPGQSQPPICVQSVYVGKREDDDDESCKKKDKKKSGGDCGEGDSRRRRRTRRQRRRYMDPTFLRTLLNQSEDMADLSDPADPSDPCENCCNSSPRIVYIDNQ